MEQVKKIGYQPGCLIKERFIFKNGYIVVNIQPDGHNINA